jgi:hypothetical protein
MIKLNQAEIDAVSALPRDERAKHFVKRVVDSYAVWGIQDDGWILAGSKSGKEVFQVWPFEEYARRCCVGEWATCTPGAIPLDEFKESYLPDFGEKGILVGVFYTPAENGVLMQSGELLDLLQSEEDEWY